MTGRPYFTDRYDAGRLLGAALRKYATARPLVVLGLPRGGVPVASPVAEALDAPLDVCVVRKLGVPGHEELALGAIASGGAKVLNGDIIQQLRIPPAAIERVVAREQRELERREALFRDSRPFPVLAGATVILVDDGAATGASMRAAVVALRALGPRAIIAATPVASRDAVQLLRQVADHCVCLLEPEPFFGVGFWYQDFSETSDDEVRMLLAGSQDGQRAFEPVHAG